MIYVNMLEAIRNLRPGANFAINGDTYEGLIWNDENELLPPTKEEVEAEVARLQAEYDAKEYQRQRVPEYPSIGDQLDAIWKGGDAYDAMLAKVMAIKDKYPKPE